MSMVPRFSESQHYQYWAIHYAGESVLKQCDASVHVEAEADALFWKKIFKHFAPGKRFNFVYQSLTPRGSMATGVSHCLKYKAYLSKRFFICIDSDYRYVMQSVGFTPRQFVFQTYTYSIENHFCYARMLNHLNEKSTGGIPNTLFDFEIFLTQYSQTIYETLVWHLYLVRRNEKAFSKNEFSQIIQLQQSAPYYDIKHNGEAVIHELSRRCKLKLAEITEKFPQISIEAEKERLALLGLLPHTAYWYVRGHNLFDLICAIGIEVNNQLFRQLNTRQWPKSAKRKIYEREVRFKTCLDNHIVFDDYYPMKKIKEDIESFF